MNRRLASMLAAACLLPAAPVRAQAIQNVVLRNSFSPLGAGARGLGMGGAFIAVADDGTAASFNPAGLAQLRRSELAVVGFGSTLESTLTIPRFDGVFTESEETRHGALDFVGLSVPFEAGGRNLTVQLSYQRAVDLFGEGSAELVNRITASELIADVDTLRALGLTPRSPVDLISVINPKQSGAFHAASAAIAYQTTQRLSLGLSLNYWVAEWDARGDASFAINVPRPGGQRPLELFRSDTSFGQDQSLRGFNLNTGFLLRYPKLSIGGVLRLPFDGDYDLAEINTVREFLIGQGLDSATTRSELTSRIRWPRSAGIGIALRPFNGLTLAADYSTSHWSRAVIQGVPDGALLTPGPPLDDEGEPELPRFTDRNFFDLLPASQTATLDTDSWRVGGEYLVTFSKLVIPLRGGYFRDQSPIADFISDEGRTIDGWTLGTGLNFNRIVLDVAFERRESDGLVGLRVRGGNLSDQATTEAVTEDRIVASLIYRFGGDDDPLKRLLRAIFVGPKEEGDE